MPQKRIQATFLFESLEHRRLLASDFKPTSLDEPQAIVGGDEVERGTEGWVVSLQSRGGHFCGGTLVSAVAVVTAAHCVEGESTVGLSAVVGREDLDRGDGQRTDVTQIVVHPNYDSDSLDADLAVVFLENAVSELPIRYLTPSDGNLAAPGTDATILGWGTTREGGASVTKLRSATVPIVSNAVANAPVAYRGGITDNMLAAGFATGGVDSCQGDSGGPLVVADGDGNPRLAGVVSWGEGCARANKYGIYTRVTEFAEWIDEQVGVDSLGEVNFSQPRYFANSIAEVRLRDGNLVTSRPVDVVLRSASGDEETLSVSHLI